MIKAILTDLDGVLRHWNNKSLFAFEEAKGLEKGFLFSCAFKEQFVHPAIVGEVSHEQWLDNVVSELENVVPQKLAKQLIKQWKDSTSEIDWRVVDEYQAAFPDVPIVLVSNATTRMDQDLKGTGLLEILSNKINSSEIGLAKPNPGFFNVTLNTIACLAEEVLFIDDQIENIDAATQLGIHSFHFQGFDSHKNLESLKTFLARFS
ncbi:MAG: HAD-IA family hydrolase [Pseudomonadales bacterium]|nr:HAD-IA family hydrolase [Pseudomonadales bacterium]